MQRYNQRLIEELKNKQAQEKARLPKIQRSDAKTRMAMYKKSLRITATAAITPEQERERIKLVQTASPLILGSRVLPSLWHMLFKLSLKYKPFFETNLLSRGPFFHKTKLMSFSSVLSEHFQNLCSLSYFCGFLPVCRTGGKEAEERETPSAT